MGFENGSVVVIECDEDIPCNPCEDICPKGAIYVGIPITNLPRLDANRCNGCCLCITVCPGLCMFVVHKNYSDTESLIFLPYELNPLPISGMEVNGCDRRGEVVCRARVIKVVKAKSFQKTAIVAVSIPKEYFEIVRSIRF
ncbi:MAG: NADH-quinone oxidoreductase subunit I [Thermodesulfovibrionales bacterium]